MIINDIDQCTTVRSSVQIQQKSTKEEKKDTHFNVMNEMKCRINKLSTRD
jgi:hypothetical protein